MLSVIMQDWRQGQTALRLRDVLERALVLDVLVLVLVLHSAGAACNGMLRIGESPH